MIRLVSAIILAIALIKPIVVTAATCADDPNECTPKNLCEMTTEVQGGQKVWTSKTGMSKHISFAKQLGMDCGASDPKDPCDLDANECKISELCERASIGGDNKQWNLDNPDHVRLAREYSLSCDVKEENPPKVVSCNLGAEQTCTDEQICTKATYDGAWVSIKTYQPFVTEAKKRGLDCGVGEQNTKSISCKDIENLKICSAEELCQMATTVKNGSTVWANKYSVYRLWAKERGLNCGVKTIEPVVQSTTCIASKPEGCGTTQLCQLATTKRSGVLTWTSPNSSFKKEAVKRGLKCDVFQYDVKKYARYNYDNGEVSIGVVDTNRKWNGERLYVWPSGHTLFKIYWAHDDYGNYEANRDIKSVFPILYSKFSQKTQAQRKNIHRNLSNKKMYNNAIDGLWGRNTLIALVEYSSRKFLTIRLDNPVLVDEVLRAISVDSSNRTYVARWDYLNGVHKAIQDQKNIQNKSSAFKSSFLNQSQLKRKQIQYALNKLGYYRSGIDGLWGNGTKNALTSFASAEGLGSNTPSAIFSRLLSKVSVPSTFAAPKQYRNSNNKSNSNNKGWVALSSNPKLPFDDAREICEAKALAEGNSYLSANQPSDRFSSVNCYGYGSNSYSCRRSSGGGVAGGILRAWDEADNRNAAKKLAQAVAKACMADYGWIKK